MTAVSSLPIASLDGKQLEKSYCNNIIAIYHDISSYYYIIIMYYKLLMVLYTVDLESFGVKKLRKAQTSTKLKHMRFFAMTILLSNN